MSRRDSRNSETTAPAVTAKSGSVEDCKTTLKAMQDAKSALQDRNEAIKVERESLAGSALIDGDALAAKKLEQLSVESARIAIDVQNLDAGCAAAEGRVRDAEGRALAAREFEAAGRVLEILSERQELAAQAQRAIDEHARHFAKIVQLGREARALSPRAAGERTEGLVIRTTLQLAKCALHRLGLLSSEPLPPADLRHSMPDLLAHIDAGALAWAETITASGDHQKGAA